MGEESTRRKWDDDGAVAADDPIDSPADDVLGRGPFVKQVATLIGGASNRGSSTVFGLVAPWGAGKTSLLNLIRRELDGEGWSVVEFNPWELSDIQSLTREFIVSLSAALPGDKKGTKAREALRKYGRRAGSMASLVNVPGIDLGKLIEVLAESVDSDESLADLRHRLETRLRGIDTPVLLVIDDIDRLQADELLTLLKLVRVVGRLPNVSYLLAYDEGTLRGVLQQSDVAADSTRAQAYLEKIVQIRIDVPPVHSTHRSSMVDAALEGIGVRHGLTLDDVADRRFGSVYHEALAAVLAGPRQIKRYFAQLEAFMPLVVGEVDFVDFAIMTALRTFFPDLYAALPAEKRGLTGTEFTIERMSAEQVRERWRAFVAGHVVDEGERDVAAALLASVFRPVPDPAQRLSVGAGTAEEILQRRGVGSDEYFDRYFFLGIPPDDISDAEVMRIIEDVLTGGSDMYEKAITLLQDPNIAAALVVKLSRLSPHDGVSCRALLPLAGQMAAEGKEVGFFGGAAGAARSWLARLFDRADLHDPKELLDQLLAVCSLSNVGWAFVRGNTEGIGDLPNRDGRPAFKAALLDALTERLRSATAVPIAETADLPGLLFLWAELESDEVVREWFQLASVVPPWTVEDAATVFIERRRFLGVEDWRLGAFDRERAERLLGLEFILDHTPEATPGELDTSDPLPWFDDAPDTESERLSRVRSAIFRLRNQRAAEGEQSSDSDEN